MYTFIYKIIKCIIITTIIFHNSIDPFIIFITIKKFLYIIRSLKPRLIPKMIPSDLRNHEYEIH